MVQSFLRSDVACVGEWRERIDRKRMRGKRKIGKAKRIGKKRRGRESWISSSDDEAQYP